MNKPFITIVHGDQGCKLLLLFEDDAYYSHVYPYKELMYFKNPSNLTIRQSQLVLSSKNGKQQLILTKLHPQSITRSNK